MKETDDLTREITQWGAENEPEKIVIKVKKPEKMTAARALKNFDKWVENTDCLDAKPHQREGVKWCLNKELQKNPLLGVRGGLIADEMGLGKTYTMIGVVVSNLLKRTLVVLPLALLGQWYRHISKTTDLNPVTFMDQTVTIFWNPNSKCKIVLRLTIFCRVE